jgi:hypothetical protein
MHPVLVKPLPNNILQITFENGEIGYFNIGPLMEFPVYQILKNTLVFKKVSINNGIIGWLDGELDIAPSYFSNGSSLEIKSNLFENI